MLPGTARAWEVQVSVHAKDAKDAKDANSCVIPPSPRAP